MFDTLTEIVEQTANRCIVKSISSDQPEEVDILIRRCFLVAMSLARLSYDALSSRNFDKLNDSLVMEATVNRLSNYCERLINKSPYKDEKALYKYLVVWLLESICDDYRDMCQHALSNRRNVLGKDVLGLYEGSVLLLDGLHSFFYKYSDAALEQMRSEVAELKRRSMKLKLNPYETEFVTHIFCIASRIYDCFGAIIGLNL